GRLVLRFATTSIEAAEVEHEFRGGETLPIAGGLQVVHAPGHCKGQLVFLVHPEVACAGLEKRGHADSTWSCVKGLRTGRAACPPAFCIRPSASAVTTTSAPTIEAAR